MKQIKKTMFVMIASLVTMSLFSFRSADKNEVTLGNGNVSVYASSPNAGPGDPVYFTGAILRVVVRVFTNDCKAVVVNLVTSLIVKSANQASIVDQEAKSRSMLADL